MLSLQLISRFGEQNIHGLDTVAGISSEKLIQYFGSFQTAPCVSIDYDFHINGNVSSEEVKKRILSFEVPQCDACCSLVKPDIVFFGEAIAQDFLKGGRSDM